MEGKYTGIILNKIKSAEADRIYTIFTSEEGKIKTLGKGVRRPNSKLAGLLEPITYAEFFVAKKKGLGKITSSIPICNFSKLKSDLESLKHIAYVFKALDKLLPDKEKEENVFILLLEYLNALEAIAQDDAKRKKEILTLGALFKILKDLGYQIEVGKCMICERKLTPEQNYFSYSRGGAICSQCGVKENNKIKIENDSIKFIRIFFKNNINNLKKISCSKEIAMNLWLIMDKFLSWIVQ